MTSVAAVKDATIQWVSDTTRLWNRRLALTLTFRSGSRSGRSREAAKQTFRHYLRRLSRKALNDPHGRRGLKLKVVPVIEGGERVHETRLHYHCVFRVPDYLSDVEFATMCLHEWASMEDGSTQQMQAFLNPDEGWNEYILKWRSKPVYVDALDVENMWLGDER